MYYILRIMLRAWLESHSADLRKVVAYLDSRYSIGHDAAEDCVQSAVLKLLKSPRPVGNPFAAVVSASLNCAKDHIAYLAADRRRRENLSLETPPAEAIDEGAIMVPRTNREAYNYAQAIAQGFSVCDVAALFGVHPGRVYSRIRCAR